MLVEQLLLNDVLIGAVHFCRFDDARGSSPEQLLGSLAAKREGRRCKRRAGREAKDKGDVDLLFAALVAAPLRAFLAATMAGTWLLSSTRSTSSASESRRLDVASR